MNHEPIQRNDLAAGLGLLIEHRPIDALILYNARTLLPSGRSLVLGDPSTLRTGGADDARDRGGADQKPGAIRGETAGPLIYDTREIGRGVSPRPETAKTLTMQKNSVACLVAPSREPPKSVDQLRSHLAHFP